MGLQALKRVAIVGATGSGKTSLARALVRRLALTRATRASAANIRCFWRSPSMSTWKRFTCAARARRSDG